LLHRRDFDDTRKSVSGICLVKMSAVYTRILTVGIVLATPVFVASPAIAQVTPAASEPKIAGAVGSLLDNANFWRSHGQPEFALSELNRVLLYAPNQPDVLAAAAEVALELDNYDAAVAYRTALARVAPDDPRVAALAAEHQRTPDEIAALADARALARAGKTAEAVARFKAVFKDGVVPRSLVLEYYGLLGSTADGIDEANEKLSALATQFPKDARVQLAYAQFLVKQEDTRPDGIKRLSELANVPEVEMAARQAWRDVMLWQGPSERARTQLDFYLKNNPTDAAIEAKRREFDAVLPDEGSRVMLRGYNATDPTVAKREFLAALAINPKNPEAMVSLAGIYRSEQRLAEAQALINSALAIAPERRDDLLKTAGGDYPGPVPFGIRELVQVSILTNAKRYDEAEQLLAVRLGNPLSVSEKASTLVQMGNIQRLAGKLPEAEASYRQAQTLAPARGDAACGLADVLMMTGHYDEAAASYTKAATLFTQSKDSLGVKRVAQSRAVLLDQRASLITDVASATALYQAALTANPKDMYARLSYARFLVKNQQTDQAWDVINTGLKLNANDSASQQIAFDFATETGNTQAFSDLSKRFGAHTSASSVDKTERQLRIQAEIKAASFQTMTRTGSTPSTPAP
jgi:tetratricopeptide (TPR) repeat protein